MSAEIEQLVADAIDLTGAAPPALLDDAAPVLTLSTDVSLYLIGLIGGKDVGKSSIVNALVGHEITRSSSVGEGTQRVIAYTHESALSQLRAMLEREVSGQFEIITHRVDRLKRQVLLDLPDIDSHYTSHVQITRRMLRHMLFPLWVQSIEKYGDLQPQALLAQVAEGNDPANFLFCLNKVDQLIAREGDAAARELADDHAKRIARTLKLAAPPRVYLVSAQQPDAFDLPDLRRTLSSEKSGNVVERSMELAGKRRDRSLLDWLTSLNLADRADRARRILSDAQELTAARIAVPLLEEMLPRIVNDPGYRMGLVEPVMNRRLSRWPIVNVIQSSLSPVIALVKKSVSASPVERPESAALTAGGRPLSALVQTTFAQLRQSNALVAERYDHRKLWLDHAADLAANDLSQRIAATVEAQRDEACKKIAPGGASEIIFAPIRWLLTIGALLWFPLIQPILERALNGQFILSYRAIAALIVPLLGATYLLHSAAFLVIYLIALWMLLRWDTHRRADRLIARWSIAKIDSTLSLQGVCIRWIDELLEPLQQHADEAGVLSARLKSLQTESPVHSPFQEQG